MSRVAWASVGDSWQPVNIASVLAGDLSPLEPTRFAREDGQHLLYPGRVNALIGEPESCKSFAAQIAAGEVLKDGGSVWYLDFESEARDVVGHLLALGVPAGDILKGLVYVRPDEPIGDAVDLLHSQRDSHLTVVDGVNSALVSNGLEPNSNKDVALFWEKLVRPLQRVTDGPLVTVDHVAKDREHRGDWAVGAGHKKALVDGAMLAFELIQPFGRGRTGLVKILVFKDRPGALRGQAVGKEIARLQLVANVAYRRDHEQRLFNWRWVKALLQAHFPDWPIYEFSSDERHWNKMTALNRAIAKAAAVADLVVIYDESCFLAPTDLLQLVELARGPARWSLPTLVARLTRAATRRVLASDPAAPVQVDEDPRNRFQRCGQPENIFSETPIPIFEPMAVIQSMAIREVGPLDDMPWGGAEWWAGVALDTLIGPPAMLPADSYHLWHPASESGSHRAWVRRLMQYELAYGDRAVMRELVAGEDLNEKTLLRLMKRWAIPTERGRFDDDLLDVCCSAIRSLRPAPAELVGLGQAG